MKDLPRAWHTLTAVVAVAALALQLGLVIDGASVLVEEDPPGLGTRLARLVSYFTIQSNVLVALGATLLARDPRRDGAGFRALRLAGTAGITVTGLVHFFLLRPLLDLDGASYAADKLLHMAVPALAVVGWIAFGPRPRVEGRALAIALGWPIVWLLVILVVGGVTGWVPYPFLDIGEEGWASVLGVCVGITALFCAVLAILRYADRRLGAR